MLEETLVVWATEFGRTPGSEKSDGRDHHPYGFSVWMAGGGIKGGQVVGETDELGWSPIEDPIHINDWHATIMHLFGFDHHRFVVPFKGLNVRLTNQGGRVVKKLLA